MGGCATQVRLWTADWRCVGDLSGGTWDLAARATAGAGGPAGGSRPGTGPLPAGAARGLQGVEEEGDGGETGERLWALLQGGGAGDGAGDLLRPAGSRDAGQHAGPAEDSSSGPVPPETALAAFLARSAELFPQSLTAAAAAAAVAAAGLAPTRSAAMRAALPVGWARSSSRRDAADCFRRIPLAELADTRRPPPGRLAGDTPDRAPARGVQAGRGRVRAPLLAPGGGLAGGHPQQPVQRDSTGGGSGGGGLGSRIALWSFAPEAATLPPVGRPALPPRSVSSMN